MEFKQCCFVAVGAIILATNGFVNEGYAYRGGPVVGIGIPVPIMPMPPTIVISGPPELVVVPGTDVYVAPDVEGDMVFYQGYWWRLFDGRWYRSRSYDGGWMYMERGVPRAIYGFRPGFRHHYSGHQRLHYDEVRRHHEGSSGSSHHNTGSSGSSLHKTGSTGSSLHNTGSTGSSLHKTGSTGSSLHKTGSTGSSLHNTGSTGSTLHKTGSSGSSHTQGSSGSGSHHGQHDGNQ